MSVRPEKFLFVVITAAINLFFFNFAHAEERGTAIENAFLNYLDTELFSESPLSENFLHEYRTGHLSWEISKIINGYTTDDVSRSNLTQTIEESILDVTEFSRFSKDEAGQNRRAYEINRYYLDPFQTDYLRNFVQRFEVPLFPNDKSRNEVEIFEVVIRVFKKNGADQDTIEANLFWRHY